VSSARAGARAALRLLVALATLGTIAPAVAPGARAQERSVAAPAAPGAAELDGHVHAGWREFEAGRFAGARKHFEQAARLAPLRADVQLGLAEALFWLGEHERAAAHYERAAQLAPELAQAHSGLGHAYLNLASRAWQEPRTSLSLLARAEAAFARALAIDPEHRGARDGQRFVAELRKPKGSPLLPLELPIAALLVALFAAAVLRVRKHGLPDPGAYLWPLGLFAVTRLLVFAAFAAAPGLLPEAPSHPEAVLRAPDHFVLDTVAGRWDANLYVVAAVEGYRIPPLNAYSQWATVGQFPMLPVLLRWLSLAIDDALIAALVLPNLALLLACFVAFDLFRARHGMRVATLAVGALLVHPGSLHGSVLYAESLALLGLAGLSLNLQRGAPGQATLWGLFAGLSRINTLAIVPALVFGLWRGEAARPRGLRTLFACISPLIGLGLYMLYLHVEFGNAFAYFDEMRMRRLGGGPMFTTLWEVVALLGYVTGLRDVPPHGGPVPVLMLGLASLATYIAVLAVLVRTRRFEAALFVAAGIFLAAGSTLAAQPRYLWLLLPAAPVLARVCDRPFVRWVAPLASLGALLGAAVGYARWYFVP
jgi:tetratricopeptide (TPR) repeat protein